MFKYTYSFYDNLSLGVNGRYHVLSKGMKSPPPVERQKRALAIFRTQIIPSKQKHPGFRWRKRSWLL